MLKGNCNKLIKYEKRVRDADMSLDTETRNAIVRSNTMKTPQRTQQGGRLSI